MTFLRSLLCASALVAGLQTAQAETVVNNDHQENLSLTLYQNGLGFIRDQRAVSFTKGTQDIVFEDISRQLIPDSLLISGTGYSVLERRFAFDLLTPQVLLEKSVGKEVMFSRLNPVTGKDELIKAKVLSTQGQVIIERDGKIQVGQPGQLVLDQLPEGLRPRPALMAKLDVDKSGKSPLALGYLSNGLNWKVSYSGEISKDGTSVELRSWANLTNTSGADYKNAQLFLASGTVNSRSKSVPVAMMARGASKQMMTMAMDAAPEMAAAPPQSLGGIHLYELNGKLDLKDRETKQAALMAPLKVESKRVLVQRYNPVYGKMHAEGDPTHPNIELSFTNTSGQPLPDGLVRLYRKDSQGQLQFIGEDRLQKTPNKADAKLRPGKSFDVTVKRIQSDYDVIGKNRFEAAYKVTIHNAKKTTKTVRIEDMFPGEWKLQKSTIKPTTSQGQKAKWVIEMKPETKTILEYRVAVQTR